MEDQLLGNAKNWKLLITEKRMELSVIDKFEKKLRIQCAEFYKLSVVQGFCYN